MKTNVPVAIQAVWGWKVAAHLFVVGVSAGTYIAGFILLFLSSEASQVLAVLAVCATAPLLIAGLCLIFSQLGNKANAVRAFRRPASSWLARGIIALVIFLVLDLVHIGLWVWPSTILVVLPVLHFTLGTVTTLFALFVLVYTGMLLKRLKPFPFWNTWLLPLLFVVSGISGGLMLLVLLLALYAMSMGFAVMASLLIPLYYNNFVLVIQGLVLGFYLWRAQAVSTTRSSFLIITRGSGAIAFWLGVVLAGLLIPFGFGLYMAYSPVVEQVVKLVLIVGLAVFGLVGGLLLRYLVLSAGRSISLTVEGDAVPLPETARVPASQCVHYR